MDLFSRINEIDSGPPDDGMVGYCDEYCRHFANDDFILPLSSTLKTTVNLLDASIYFVRFGHMYVEFSTATIEKNG